MLCPHPGPRYARLPRRGTPLLAPLLAVLFAFPTALFTALLGVVLLYWLFVIVGAAHLDLLGDGAADGALDGGMDGLDAGHADVGHVHVDADGDVGDGDAD